jgi:outer membrane protein, multidrug efflux system
VAQERVIEARAARDSLPLASSLSPSAQVQREQQDGSSAQTRATLPGLEAAIARLKTEIAVLSGRQPGEAGPDLDSRTSQPRATLSPKVGIPADLLRNRPDIRVAERNDYAALRDVKTAQAARYPQLSLGGTLSLASLSGNQSTDFIFGPALRLPILPATDGRASVQLRESRVRQAHTLWRLRLLEAIGDVERALSDYDASRRARSAAQDRVNLYAEALRLTRDSVGQNGATVRDLIDAEQNLSAANAGLTAALRQMGLSYIALNISLGAGNRYGQVAAALE